MDGHIVKAIDDGKSDVIVWHFEDLEQGLLTIRLIQPLAHRLQALHDLRLVILERSRLQRHSILLDHDRVLLAEKLDQLDDLDEAFVDDWLVLVFE